MPKTISIEFPELDDLKNDFKEIKENISSIQQQLNIKVYSIQDVAEITHLSYDTVRSRALSGILKPIDDQSPMRFTHQEVMRYLSILQITTPRKVKRNPIIK